MQADYLDTLHFNAYYYVPDGTQIPPTLSEAAISVRSEKGKGSVFTLVSYQIETATWQERQATFELAAANSVETLKNAAISDLHLSGGVLRIVFGVVPEEGEAGIAIDPEVLKVWSDFRAEVHISAWPGQIWQDARALSTSGPGPVRSSV